jgi:hypothetical protein
MPIEEQLAALTQIVKQGFEQVTALLKQPKLLLNRNYNPTQKRTEKSKSASRLLRKSARLLTNWRGSRGRLSPES